LEERPTGLKEITNGYGKILLLNPSIYAENEPVSGAASGNDATSNLSFLFFNFK
jgi:hypothetical protein